MAVLFVLFFKCHYMVTRCIVVSFLFSWSGLGFSGWIRYIEPKKTKTELDNLLMEWNTHSGHINRQLD